VAKFSAIHQSLDLKEPSKTDDDIMQNEACLYSQKVDYKLFVYKHFWILLCTYSQFAAVLGLTQSMGKPTRAPKAQPTTDAIGLGVATNFSTTAPEQQVKARP
jgi:hypothetical protein